MPISVSSAFATALWKNVTSVTPTAAPLGDSLCRDWALDGAWRGSLAGTRGVGENPRSRGLWGVARARCYAAAGALWAGQCRISSEAVGDLTSGAFSELAKRPSIGR